MHILQPLPHPLELNVHVHKLRLVLPSLVLGHRLQSLKLAWKKNKILRHLKNVPLLEIYSAMVALVVTICSCKAFFHARQFFCQSAAKCNYTSFTNHSKQPSTSNTVLNRGKGVNQTISKRKDNPFESYYEAGYWHWNDRKTILALRRFCS